MAEDHGGDLLGGEGAGFTIVLDFNGDLVAVGFDDLVGESGELVLDDGLAVVVSEDSVQGGDGVVDLATNLGKEQAISNKIMEEERVSYIRMARLVLP